MIVAAVAAPHWTLQLLLLLLWLPPCVCGEGGGLVLRGAAAHITIAAAANALAAAADVYCCYDCCYCHTP